MIRSLTLEQKSMKAVYKDKYIKLGLSTEPINQDEARNKIIELYEALKLKAPKIVFTESPLAAHKILNNLTGKKETYYPALIGSSCIHLMAFYDFFATECNMPLVAKKLAKYKALTSLGLCYLYENIAVISEKPIHIWKDARGRLHNPDRKAIEFSDGFGLYFWQGTKVPGYLIEEPEKITQEAIYREKNKEIQRCMISMYGIDKLMSKAKVIDTDDWGTLIQFEDLKDSSGDKLTFVKVVNSTPEVSLHLSKSEIDEVFTRVQSKSEYQVSSHIRHGDVILVIKQDTPEPSIEEKTELMKKFRKELDTELRKVLYNKKVNEELIWKDYFLQVEPTCKTVSEAFSKSLYRFKPGFMPIIQS